MPRSSPLRPSPDDADRGVVTGDWLDRASSWLPRPLPARAGVWLAAGLVVLAVAVGAVVVVSRGSGSGSPPVSLPMAHGPGTSAAGAGGGDGSPTIAAGQLIVQAAGAVTRPGVYRLAAGTRVGDLVDAAGGLTPEADPDRINLAAPLADGARIYLLRRGEAEPGPVVDGGAGSTTGGPDTATAPVQPLDLNTATVDQLDSLPGVGPATAAAIVDDRRQHGPFGSVDDLARVRGIGPAKLAALRSRVRV